MLGLVGRLTGRCIGPTRISVQEEGRYASSRISLPQSQGPSGRMYTTGPRGCCDASLQHKSWDRTWVSAAKRRWLTVPTIAWPPLSSRFTFVMITDLLKDSCNESLITDVTLPAVQSTGPWGEDTEVVSVSVYQRTALTALVPFLGLFAKSRKATSNFIMCVCIRLSVCPHGTTRLSLDGFSYNLTFKYFSKFCLENLSFIKMWQE